MSTPQLHYTSGWKYQVAKSFSVQLHNGFRIKKDFNCRYYSVTKTGLLTAHAGCCWDGPTWFPDFKWMYIPSLIHDILHWLIAKGIIGMWANDLIDVELDYWIQQNKGWNRLYRFRGGYIRWATNRVDQKLGQEKEVHIV
jgi:hypothetical protein